MTPPTPHHAVAKGAEASPGAPLPDAGAQGGQPKGYRRVLIVSPHFSPINAPDMQRVRIALPYLKAMGWEAVVLAISPELIEGGVLEPALEKTYPSEIRVVRVGGISQKLTRRFGIGSLWLRCGRALRIAGESLLAAERFDLIFFSTTQFDSFNLGPIWKAKFGVPYVLDYQDPWINDYYSRTHTPPPGGKLKFAYSQWCARRSEPRVLREASGIIAVSGAYGTTLAKNHPGFDASRVRILPFGASETDMESAKAHVPADMLVPRDDGKFHLVYAGRCGPDMTTSMTLIFRAFRLFLERAPEKAKRVRFHFIGTDYAPRPFGREWAIPVAEKEGIRDYVDEHCYRVPYFDALSYLVHADALIAVGSNDPTYSASKIFPYVLASRPTIVVFNEMSPILAIAKELNCGLRYEFNGNTDIDALSERIAEEWFIQGGMSARVEGTPHFFDKYTAESMTRALVGCFDSAVESFRNPSQ